MRKKTFVFPKLTLRPEAQEYLRNVFTNKELVAAVGHEEAESRFDELLCHLSHPPSFTCVRASTHLEPLDVIRERLLEKLRQMGCYNGGDIPVLSHTQLPDVLLLHVIGPRPALPENPEVIVGAQCGNAVLRGAHVFAPGILSAPKYMKAGDKGNKVFVGNGVAEMARADIFCSDEPVKGVGIRMVEPVYLSPSFDDLLPSLVFLQNLPSVVVGHVLGPRPGGEGSWTCARRPGGRPRTSPALMKGSDQRARVSVSARLPRPYSWTASRAYCFNSIQAVRTEHAQKPDAVTDGPPFPEESFDRVLLDAPCSGLGQRPNMGCFWSLREIRSYQPLQRQALPHVRLLKRGGTGGLGIGHSFPCLTLQPQEPHIGGEGMLGAGLSQDQLRLLQRFSPVREPSGLPGDPDPEPGAPPLTGIKEMEPARLLQQANTDTIGFFIAKFVKT
ncbi:hypothetical protein SKAU_G00073190 [Synaphobranchus kaupii]|uniref:Methyltransferase NSUN6 n=1 Tax=Synaphobranchus kaupii TaxID=118154 RepID=A0A9Q1J9Q6_SYNKA|nr:hypothetical protein SKAU_G00073190 [Synaphobranchus kaupii]